jgi:septum formation protein
MLRQLSGREHRVVTGLCVRVICDKESRLFLATEQTQVTFGDLTAAKIDWYVATGEPLDKAGAYGIQGYGSALVKSIRGCYYNVVGLPVFRLLELFDQARQAFPLLQDSLQFLPW